MLSLALAAGAPAAPHWDHPGYDAEDSHYNPAESVVNADSIRRLAKKWQVNLRTSDASCAGFSAPVLSGGRIFTSDQLGISAYAPADGAVRWRYNWLDPMDTGTPVLAVADGLVIAAGGDCNSQSDPDGTLTALDVRTGRLRWQLNQDVPIRSVVVDKGAVVVSGSSPSDEDTVAAYAVRDGGTLWTKPKYATSGVSANGTILIRKTDGYDVPAGESAGVEIGTGRIRWTRKAAWTAQAADPGSERFYVTDRTGRLSAVRVADGMPAWTATGTVNEMIAVDRNRIYRASGTTVEALNAADGKRLWTARQPVGSRQPVVAGGLLYAGGPVLDPATGAVAGPALPGQLIIAGGRLHQVKDTALTVFAR